jgi:chaperonin cofactor prefoldin
VTYELEVDLDDVVTIYSALLRAPDRDEVARTLGRLRAQLAAQDVVAELTEYAARLLADVASGEDT